MAAGIKYFLIITNEDLYQQVKEKVRTDLIEQQ